MEIVIGNFECDNCHVEFSSKPTLLRHVSHKKACKLFYGEDRLEEMRIEGRLKSKRRWWKGHELEAKKKYQVNKDKIKERKKQRYVKAEQRSGTDAGRAFSHFYLFTYNFCKEEAMKTLAKSDFPYDKVYKKAVAHTMDMVMNDHGQKDHKRFSNLYVLNANDPIFKSYDPNKPSEGDKDYPVAEEIEKAMIQAYEYNFKIVVKREMEAWLDSVSLQISEKCRNQGETSAFNMFFDQFCATVFPTINEESLERTFASLEDLDENVDDVEIEQYLAKKYLEFLEKEAIEAAIETDLAYSLQMSLEPKIEKQVRFMKAFESEYLRKAYGGLVEEKIVYLRK